MKATLVNVHASCVRLGRAGAALGAPRDAGVLLLGDSGAGKSDLALRLIVLGAELVADDRVDLFVTRGRLKARAPRTIRGLIEIRGLGIVEIPYTEQVRVALAVQLVRKTAERLPRHDVYVPPAGIALPASARPPLIRIAAFEISAAQKLIAAAAAFAHRLFRDSVKPR
jgi:serine kinase of HPr protein (carbohydrate metabolism regulator)